MRMRRPEFFTLNNIIVCTVHVHSQVIKSTRLRWAGHVTRMGDVWSTFRILTGEHIGKRSLGWPRRK